MTEELFLGDAYLKEFEHGPARGRPSTDCYPGGGGQPATRARSASARSTRTPGARREGGGAHVLDNAIPETVRELKGSRPDPWHAWKHAVSHGVARALRRDLAQLRREGDGRPDAPRPRQD